MVKTKQGLRPQAIERPHRLSSGVVRKDTCGRFGYGSVVAVHSTEWNWAFHGRGNDAVAGVPSGAVRLALEYVAGAHGVSKQIVRHYPSGRPLDRIAPSESAPQYVGLL